MRSLLYPPRGKSWNKRNHCKVKNFYFMSESQWGKKTIKVLSDIHTRMPQASLLMNHMTLVPSVTSCTQTHHALS